MSQYPPPSFDGQQNYNYALQWPLQTPASLSTPSQHVPSSFAMNAGSYGIGNFPSMPFGMNAPAQLPGLGMQNSTIPPPPLLSQQIPNSQISTPFYSGFNSSVSALTNSLHPPQQLSFAHPAGKVESLPIQPLNKQPKDSLLSPRDNTDPEEGEVSDGSGFDLSAQKNQYQPKPSTTSQASPEGPISIDQTTYSPPLTIAMNEPSQEVTQKPTTVQMQNGQSGDQTNHASHSTGKSPTQIRIMAQGALLRLAPHNIRFNELIKEDIDPAILKRLYDDIGIKVAVTETQPSEKVITGSDATQEQTTAPISGQLSKAQESLVGETPPTSMPNGKAKEASISASDKPLERKDVIARMLAEKAKKKAPITVTDSVPSQAVSSDSITTQNTEKAAPDLLPLKTQAVSQPKEKNKAQTELARQRIEQLKKMGLKRQQSQAEGISLPRASSSSSAIELATSNLKPETPVTLHHPLPERPPATNQMLGSPKPSTPQIPGLSVSSEPVKIGSPSTIETRPISTSTPFKNSLGKRPRASDFDEPIPETGKPLLTESRLVIDISEDESSNDDDDGDDDEDIVMSEASDSGANPQTSKINSTMLRNTLSRNASSASATPQSRPSDSENLRLKNLEIQAMRRRIAEWEKKNSKKANPTLPLAAVTNADSEPSPQVGETQSMTEKVNSMPTASDKPSFLGLQRSPSVQSLASMDTSDLDRIRQKLLRKREIESGLPALDAEMLKFKAKLAEFKREEEKLLNEMAKSQAERKQLDDELQSLGMETEGLSLEELKAAKEDMERTAAARGEPEPHAIVNAEATPLSKDLQAAPTTAEPTQPMEQKSPVPGPISFENDGVNDVAEVEDSSSESSGSSMDESTSDSESISVDQKSESEQQPIILPVSAPSNDDMSIETPQAPIVLPPKPDFTTTVSIDTPAVRSDVSRESSVLSDNYEPPEPEESPDEAYSPKLSPSGVEDSEMETVPNFSAQNDADMALTRKSQESVVIAFKGDALDNTPNARNTVSKFSPYQSPLKYFRAYRYHPNIIEDVGDSYRSLTYSHNIDPFQAVCPYEAAGGVCNDTTCEFQHWRDMVMPVGLIVADDKILVEMGNQKEGKTPEEQEAYIEGLKELINNMRRDQVKDFFTVAGEIAAYRRRFLSDPSRILPL
ncbi:hypothetical protein UA08_00651 [Talaromyces atroroseus]|uniref:Putative zinc-finger domain-containing protein n=1 Tax=Talaromyces atroroseus TaxID=1441469 RepID=A0A225B9D4_TALAT|nr:hypothetical protein UA08_00651 [Talaromyces atroroseus]OKL64699.1 hypothetical protein UA08_00651 [Talaromyces atroroseus]